MGAAKVSPQQARGAHCETFPVCHVFEIFRLKSLGTVWAVGWAGLKITVSYRAKSQSLARGRDGADNRAGVLPELAWPGLPAPGGAALPPPTLQPAAGPGLQAPVGGQMSNHGPNCQPEAKSETSIETK